MKHNILLCSNLVKKKKNMDSGETIRMGTIQNLVSNLSELDGDSMFFNNSEPNLGHENSAQGNVTFAYESDPFKPKIITIGPIHHKKRGSRAMEVHKKRFVASILSTGQLKLEDLTKAMKELEAETRNCYLEQFPNITCDDFVKMVLDGCFIVQLIRLNYMRSKGEHIDDPILTTRRLLPIVRRDLLLMENQLPLSVLNQLFRLTSTGTDETSFKMLALKFFEPLRLDRAAITLPPDVPSDCKHLLALIQLSCLRSFSPPKDSDLQMDTTGYTQVGTPNIQQLKSSGVRIKKNSKAKHLLDIKLKCCVLKIPTLLIDNNSNVLMRNLLAYELSNLDAPTYIASLALFYGSMVKNLEDLKVLQEAKVINKAPIITDEQVLQLIRALSNELSILQVDDFYLEEHIKTINSYFKSIWCKLYRFYRRFPLTYYLKLFIFPSMGN